MTSRRLASIDLLKTDIKNVLSLVDVVTGLGVELEMAGRELRGVCPFHEDTDPSLYISPNKGLWTCHGCKRGGDIFDFVEEMQNMTFVESLYWLAETAEIDISLYERELTEEEQEREELRGRFERWLKKANENLFKKQSEYRGLSEAVLKENEVGIAHNIPVELEGSAREGDIIYPVRDHRGLLCSFMIRNSGNEGPKYRSVPSDFPLWEEQTVSYGLHLARKSGSSTLILVEGQHDFLALRDMGIYNVTALSGSNLSQEHMDLYSSLHFDRVVLLLDNDTSGHRQMEKLVKKFSGGEPRIYVADYSGWPDGADPDDVDVMTAHDAISGAVDGIEYLIANVWASKRRQTITQKFSFIGEIQKILLDDKNLSRAELSIVAQHMSELLDLPYLEVEDLLLFKSDNLRSLESERILLGAMLRDPNKVLVLDLPDSGIFSHNKHRMIYEMIEGVCRSGIESLDLVAFRHEAQARGLDRALDDSSYIEYLLQQSNNVDLQYHRDRVVELCHRRSAVDQLKKSLVSFQDLRMNVQDVVSQTISGIYQYSELEEDVDIREATDYTMELLRDRMQSGSDIVGLDFSELFPTVSKVINGIMPGRFSLLLSSQGQGKTAFLCNMAYAVSVLSGHPSLMIEMEMSRDELVFRLLALLTGIEHIDIVAGRLSKSELRRVEKAAMRLRQSPLYIYSPDSLTKSSMEMVVRKHRVDNNIQAVWLDYVQLVKPDLGEERNNRYAQLGELSQVCKTRLARGLNIGVVAAAQMNREAKRVTNVDSEYVGDSYRLVQDADIVMIIRKTKNEDNLELFIDKNRSGRGGVLVPMIFNKKEQYFYETIGGTDKPDWRIYT